MLIGTKDILLFVYMLKREHLLNIKSNSQLVLSMIMVYELTHPTVADQLESD